MWFISCTKILLRVTIFGRYGKNADRDAYSDRKYKKELPVFPHKVAVVTSATGAAVRDILKIIKLSKVIYIRRLVIY